METNHRTAQYWIRQLDLAQHPEGGWFKEVYRSDLIIRPEGFSGARSCSTSIYYLLEAGDFSAFHRIRSDELWHFYTGNSAIEILWIDQGELHIKKLGLNPEAGEYFQILAPKNCWFAARLSNNTGFALAGCTVAPGFDFADFELAGPELLHEFSHLKEQIAGLIR